MWSYSEGLVVVSIESFILEDPESLEAWPDADSVVSLLGTKLPCLDSNSSGEPKGVDRGLDSPAS